MSTVYVITRALTVFGTCLRTFWEHVVCRICGIAAEDIRAFKSGELCGHVEHELIRKTKHSFLMCWLPFTLNFILGCMMLLAGGYKIIYIGEADSVFNYVSLWLGISCLANCAPSFEDVMVFKDNLYKGDNSNFIKVVLSPFFGIVFAMSFIEKAGITLLLAVGFAIAFPYMFSLMFPIIHEATI